MQTHFSFRQVAELWQEKRKRMVKHSTFLSYVMIVKKYLLPAFADLTEITEEEVQEFMLGLIKDGLSRHYVHDIITTLKNVAKFGAKHKIFNAPDWELEYPRDTRVRPLPVLSIADHRKLLKELSAAPTIHNIGIMLPLCTGMRIGEVCALRWDKVDFRNRTITVSSTVNRVYDIEARRTETYISTPKTRTSNREIPISPLLMTALKTVKQRQKVDTYVVGDGSRPKDPRVYRDSLYRLLRSLGIPKIVFHGLRHTFATRCIESQCDYKTLSIILGHSNITTTLSLYVHPGIDQKKRCIQRLDKLVGL